MKNRAGFTVLELIIVVMIFLTIVVGGLFYGVIGRTLICGNMWFTEKTALREIQYKNKEMVKIVRVANCSK
jgi:Tfp pilus assembly protein PilE